MEIQKKINGKPQTVNIFTALKFETEKKTVSILWQGKTVPVLWQGETRINVMARGKPYQWYDKGKTVPMLWQGENHEP